MKKIISFFTIAIGVMLWVSCQSDLSLQSLPSTATFQVIQNLTTDPGGNTVILKNTTPNSIPHFDYGSGTSTDQIDTIHFAFAGKYPVKFYACVQGGIVQGATDTVIVTGNNLNYVSDPLWTALCGGVGQSKTWIPDNGNYGFAAGFMSYANPSVAQAFESYTINWDPGNGTAGATSSDLSGTMTFDLIGGAHLTVVKPNEPTASTSGTYFLDATNHTLSTTNVSVLRIASRIAEVTNWTNNVQVWELNANRLVIAFYRTDPAQGPWWDVYNYVSKEYASSYVPVHTNDDGYNPSFKSGGILEMLAGGAGSAHVWKLDVNGDAVDWITNGNGWTTSTLSNVTGSYGWGWNDAWTAAANNSWIQFDRIGGGQNYTINQQGVISTGTFTTDDTNNTVTLTPSTLTLIKSGAGSWMDPATNVLTVVKGWPTQYSTKGVWFGTSYTASSNQWLAFHYILAQ